MKAIILAAGMGSRLAPLTNTVHKCLTEVNGTPILINALARLAGLGITETTIVVGYLQEQIKQRIGTHFAGMTISYVENSRYQETSTSYSLWQALGEVVNEDVLILEGDVFFENDLLMQFLAAPQANATVVQKYNPTLDGSFVELKNNKVSDWVHKTRRYEEFKIEDAYKTVNIHKFKALFVEQILRPMLKVHVLASGGTVPLEYVMQDIVKNDPTLIDAFQTGNMQWFEIDDVNDLRIAEQIFKKPSLKALRSFHGGYWRYDVLDFHYLCNQYFPSVELYAELSHKLPSLGNYYPSSQRVMGEMLARWKDEDYFRADNLVVGNGSSEIIKILNDHVITKATVPLPTFNEFTKLPQERLHTYVLDEATGFNFDADRLLENIEQSQSEFAIIVNPNNPVGTIIPRGDIEKVLKSGVQLVVDEAFIAFADPAYSAEQLVSQYDNLCVLVSCTKSMGIGGFRLAYLLTTNETIKEKIRAHLPIWNVNALAEHFLDIFPKYRTSYVESVARTIADTQWFCAKLQEISYLKPYPTHSNAVFCKVAGSARQLTELLYSKYNCLVKDGLNQKELVTDSYVRFGVRSRGDNEYLLQVLREIDGQKLMSARSAVGEQLGLSRR